MIAPLIAVYIFIGLIIVVVMNDSTFRAGRFTSAVIKLTCVFVWPVLLVSFAVICVFTMILYIFEANND